MHVSSSRKGKRAMNFELNLVPFIDVLSTCICFLLVTAVFINLGAFHVNQAVGNAPQDNRTKPQGSVTVNFGHGGVVRFEVKDVKGAPAQTTINGQNGKIDYKKTEAWIKSFSNRFNNVKMVLMMPNPSSKYDDLIQMMAQFKAASMDQIGIAPL